MERVRIVHSDRQTTIDRAIHWHLRQAEMTVADWDEFTLWLEADSAHADAFDRVSAIDGLIAADQFASRAASPRAANDDHPAPRRWGWIAGGGVAAAALLAVLTTNLVGTTPSGSYVVETGAGQRRTVALADGTRIEMSGGSRLRFDRGNTRMASLEAGEVTLHVRHDASAPFTLNAGDLAVRDLGTVFNVARSGERTDVAVAEGSVMLAPSDARVVLGAGDAASVADGHIARGKVSPEMVGSWRTGRLSFDSVPLRRVAERLRRLYGFRLSLAADLSERPFTGMIAMTGIADRDVPHLADLIGATWRRDGETWILAAEAPAAR